jgi:hypothetical protein
VNYFPEPWVVINFNPFYNINLYQFLDPILAYILTVNFWSIFDIFRPNLWASFSDPIFDHFPGWGSPGSKLLKIGHFLTPENRFLLYSSVYIFRSERSAPGPPILDPFFEKAQPICGEWTFYRGRFWGSETGKFLQKSAKFQKIYKKDPPGPPRRFLTFLATPGPPHGDEILAIFWSILRGSFSIKF